MISQAFFFPQLGCLRLQQELLNIGEEKLARMQDLIKLLTIAAFAGWRVIVCWTPGAMKTVWVFADGVEADY